MKDIIDIIMFSRFLLLFFLRSLHRIRWSSLCAAATHSWEATSWCHPREETRRAGLVETQTHFHPFVGVIWDGCGCCFWGVLVVWGMLHVDFVFGIVGAAGCQSNATLAIFGVCVFSISKSCQSASVHWKFQDKYVQLQVIFLEGIIKRPKNLPKFKDPNWMMFFCLRVYVSFTEGNLHKSWFFVPIDFQWHVIILDFGILRNVRVKKLRGRLLKQTIYQIPSSCAVDLSILLSRFQNPLMIGEEYETPALGERTSWFFNLFCYPPAIWGEKRRRQHNSFSCVFQLRCQDKQMIRDFLRHSLLELAKETLSSHSDCFSAGRSVQWEVSNGLGVWGDFVDKKHGHLWWISGVFLVWDRYQNEELAQLIAKGCGSKVIFLLKIITVVPQKPVEIVEHPQDDFCWNNLFSMSQRGPSTLTEGFSIAKLDVIRWRQPIES